MFWEAMGWFSGGVSWLLSVGVKLWANVDNTMRCPPRNFHQAAGHKDFMVLQHSQHKASKPSPRQWPTEHLSTLLGLPSSAQPEDLHLKTRTYQARVEALDIAHRITAHRITASTPSSSSHDHILVQRLLRRQDPVNNPESHRGQLHLRRVLVVPRSSIRGSSR